MTKINKLVMHGFKSFANRTEILFGDKFNVILGPNGSGKSNVLDSLCFVLGKSSTKSLRAEKSANLIYNGGKSKKPAKEGKVSIYFDNSKKEFPTDDPEVKITRIVKKSGQSIYKINDKKRTRQEILELMGLAKINPDGYNIILQGDIIKFTSMQASERRLLIEEISGISVYEEKKQKAVRDLERVEGMLNDAELILKERGNHLKELKKDRDQALKYKDMNDRIRQNEASYLKIQIDKIEDEKKTLNKRTDNVKNSLDKINEKIAKLKEANKKHNEENEQISKEIEDKGEVEQVKLNKEIENLKIEITKQKGRIDVCSSEIEKIDKRKQSLEENIKDVEEKSKKVAEEKKSLEKNIAEKRKELEDIKRRIEEFKKKKKIDDTGAVEKEIEDIDKESEKLQRDIHMLREEQHELLRQKDKIEHSINTLDEKIKKVMDIEKEHQDKIKELKQKRDEFKKSTLELNQLLNEDSKLAVQLGNARKKLTNAQEELAKLRVKNVSIEESASASVAVKKIMQLKNKKRGIYGTVAELGNVSSKYALALEIAAGPRIKSVVVEDDKVASECIKYLKQNKYGTATFLPLNKIKANPIRPEVIELSSAKGCFGVANDLVSYDKKFKKVFSYIFANTLVVDNIDVARRLGIGKAKMVTLDGDMCELSGVMQGGFRRKTQDRYGFKQKEITKDIDEYEQVVNTMEASIHSIEQKREENEKHIQRLREHKANLEGEIIKTEKSLHLEPGEVDLDRKQKKDLEEDLKKKETDIEKLQSKITGSNKDLTQIKIKRQELRSKIQTMKNPTVIAELQAFEEKKNEINQIIIEQSADLKHVKERLDGMFEGEKEKTIKIIKQSDKEKEDFQKELTEITKKLKENNAKLKIKEKDAQEFYQKFKALFDKRNKITVDIQKNDTEIEKERDNSREVEIKLNTYSLKLAEIKAKLTTLNQEFEKYHGVKIDLKKDEQQLKNEINKFNKMKEDIGSVNMRALDIYDEVEKEYHKLEEKKSKLSKEKEDVEKMMEEIEGKKQDLFMRTYTVINENFNQIFRLLSTKGEAHLELENKQNPLEGGVLIKVRISGDKFLDIRSLSGGEKTMTALAFIFAIQEHDPASFYVLDEVDAALDKHNSEKLAKLVGQYSSRAQYVIISHNDGVISEAENLYGVSMNEHGITNVVSLKI